MKLNTEVKKRFNKVIDTAIAEKWEGINGKKEFAEFIKTNPQNLYGLKAEGRYVTVEMIHAVCKHLNVNANYIITGTGSVRNKNNDYENMVLKIQKIVNM